MQGHDTDSRHLERRRDEHRDRAGVANANWPLAATKEIDALNREIVNTYDSYGRRPQKQNQRHRDQQRGRCVLDREIMSNAKHAPQIFHLQIVIVCSMFVLIDNVPSNHAARAFAAAT